ncbi:MAG TPA: DUF6624 domain-containing protein [Polyangia bacterium]
MNAELAQLYTEDQRDRDGDVTAIDWSVVAPRDEARRRRVAEILDAGGARTADDYRHAAMVFQHDPDDADIERAHALAEQAVAIDPTHEKARWLLCASEDRLLRRRGRPQRWGTQFHVDDAGVWTLEPVDGSIDDAERARWGVPPLADQLALAIRNSRSR